MNVLRASIAILAAFFISFFLVLAAAHAGSNVTFAWDPVAAPDLAGYRLYQSDTAGRYQYGAEHCAAEIAAGTETVTLEDVPDGAWYWVATAFDDKGNESGPSNEVTAVLDTTPPGAPPHLQVTATVKITVEVVTHK
jgi:hypothetical protein